MADDGQLLQLSQKGVLALVAKNRQQRSRSSSVDHRLMTMSTELVRARDAIMLVSTANAVNFSGLAMFDCAAATAMASDDRKSGRKNCTHLMPPTHG